MAKVHLEVGGMTCDGCARSVEKIIQKADPAGKVAVDLEKGRVEAETTADPEILATALSAAGFPTKLAA